VDNSTFKENHSSEEIEFAKKQYDELAKVSDMVITSSKLNYDYFSRLNPACYFIENAVDPVFLANPSNFPYLINKKRPRLGYAGYISERTDIDLLIHLAQNRPEYDLVLAGPVEIPQEDFEKLLLPNVQYVGVVPYGKMPDFLRNLDICLIAHRDTQFSRSMSPLKMFQYMASGRPIVSTKVAGVDRWDRLISIAWNYDEFALKVDETIRNDTIGKSRERVEAARLETWDNRLKGMADKLLEVINK
jgi:glycosyltransferase involved in cell wall biosynthesis